MEWPGKSDLASIVLLALAAIVTTITGLWRGWFGARRDVREDHSASMIHGTYEHLIADLRAELARLRAALDIAEQHVAALQQRVRTMQTRCDALTMNGE